MRRMKWLLVNTAHNIGVTAWLLSAMLVIVTAYALFILLPAQQSLNAIEALPQQSIATPETVTVVTHRIPVLEHMPSSDSLTESLQQFYSIADELGLEITEVTYTEQQKKGDSVLRYYLNFSVEQDYPTVKAFLLEVLAALPYLALDNLSFERESVEDNTVVTNLRFTLYTVQS